MCEVNCMNCMVAAFMDGLCPDEFCEKYKAIGNAEDFIKTIERKKGKWIPVTKIEEWHEEEDLTGFPPEVATFPRYTLKWVDATEPDEVDAVRCSECGEVFDFQDARNWCTECGADMRENEP